MARKQRLTRRYAHVNYMAARAAVYELDGTVRLLEVRGASKDVRPRIPKLGLHLGMWVQPAMSDEEAIDERTPYPALQKRMRVRLALDSLLLNFSTVIDPSFEEIRPMAAQDLERWLKRADEDAVTRFRQIVVNTPFPDGSSTRDAPFVGRGAEIFAEVIATQGHFPPQP